MKQKGFVLPELLIVVGLLALIAMAAVPVFSSVSDSMRLQQEAAVVVSELRYMRELSMGHPTVNVKFRDVPSEVVPRLMAKENTYYLLIGTKVYEKHVMPKEMTLQGNYDKVVFSVNGDANPVTLNLYYHGRVKYIIIDIVGRIRISDVPPEG